MFYQPSCLILVCMKLSGNWTSITVVIYTIEHCSFLPIRRCMLISRTSTELIEITEQLNQYSKLIGLEIDYMVSCKINLQ